jgi:PIN domain nuclease of toxin-antitoxin system
MKLLLDTCTFLWIVGETHRLSPRARALFASPDNEAYLSAASAMEIATKHGTGRLQLSDHPATYVPLQREARGISALAIDEESALHVARLPRIHRDPFDRFLVAQAIVHNMTILTSDPLITQYPARVIW